MIEGIVMPTVRHTGSLFMKGVLSMYEHVSLRGERKPYSLVFDHTYPLNMDNFHKWIKIFPTVVIPLRDPLATARSWSKRGNDYQYFMPMWQNLFSLAVYDPIYVPIDTGDRQDCMDHLSECLDVELQTDWTPVNTSTGEIGEIPDEVYTLYNNPIIGDRYEI